VGFSHSFSCTTIHAHSCTSVHSRSGFNISGLWICRPACADPPVWPDGQLAGPPEPPAGDDVPAAAVGEGRSPGKPGQAIPAHFLRLLGEVWLGQLRDAYGRRSFRFAPQRS